jgi:hypothetical protein
MHEVTFMCFTDPDTGQQWCETDVAPPGESAHLSERRMEHAQAYRATHGEFPDCLSDEILDLFDRWRGEYRAWYAIEQAALAARSTMRVVR